MIICKEYTDIENSGTNLVLTTNIPDSKANVLIFYGLDIESWVNKKINSASEFK